MRLRDVKAVFGKAMVLLTLASAIWFAMDLFLTWLIGYLDVPPGP